MLKIDFEFRKGIFFLRLIGDVNKKTYKLQERELESLIIANNFKYIVINVNNIKTIDIDGLNYITRVYHLIKNNTNNLVICDKFKLFQKLLNTNVPVIADEIEVL